jgi:hypothetical protein
MKQCLDNSTPTTLRGVTDISGNQSVGSDNNNKENTSDKISEVNVLGVNSNIIQEENKSIAWNTQDNVILIQDTPNTSTQHSELHDNTWKTVTTRKKSKYK